MNAAQPTEQPQIQMPVNVQVQLGPDGKHWVLLTFQDNLISTSVRLPPSAAETLSGGIGGALAKAAVQARRYDMGASGLVVAGQMPDTPPSQS